MKTKVKSLAQALTKEMKPLIVLQRTSSLFGATSWGSSYIPVTQKRPSFFWEGHGLHLDTMAKRTRMFLQQQGGKGSPLRGVLSWCFNSRANDGQMTPIYK